MLAPVHATSSWNTELLRTVPLLDGICGSKPCSEELLLMGLGNPAVADCAMGKLCWVWALRDGVVWTAGQAVTPGPAQAEGKEDTRSGDDILLPGAI